MCDKCMSHGLAKIFGEEKQRWYFTPQIHNYESFLDSQDKFTEYVDQYEILNAINPGKFGAAWVKKVIEGGRTAHVVTWEEAVEVLRIAKEANEGDALTAIMMSCICKRTRGGDVTEPICMFLIHPPKPEHRREEYFARIFKTGENQAWRMYDPMNSENMKDVLLDFEKRLGLVHIVFSIGFPWVITICNCEMPYCHSLRQRFLYGVKDAFLEGYYVARVNNDKCVGCGKCQEQCQFGAIKLDRKLGKVTQMLASCFGCGICRSVCPTNAIEMVEREKVTLLPPVEPYGLHHPLAKHKESEK